MKILKFSDEQIALLMQYISNKIDEAEMEARKQANNTIHASFLLESRKLENLFNTIYEQVK